MRNVYTVQTKHF